MAIVGYARVSTLDQDLTAQIEALKAAGCEKIFHGKQSDKSDESWERLDDLIECICDGDVVMATKFDRLGRSLNQVLMAVENIHKKGASLRTVDGQIDTSDKSPMAKAMMQLLGMFAELEHSIIVDRLQSGRERTGKKGGRNKKLSPEQEKSVLGRLSMGQSINKTAKEFDVSRLTIARIRDRAQKQSGEQMTVFDTESEKR